MNMFEQAGYVGNGGRVSNRHLNFDYKDGAYITPSPFPSACSNS